jgi:serine/threonine protein phosphatase PrpC
VTDRGLTPISRSTPSPERTPHDDEIDVFGVSHTGKVREDNQDRYLLATIHKRVDLLSSNLDDPGHLSSAEQRLAFVAMVADGVGRGSVAPMPARPRLKP